MEEMTMNVLRNAALVILMLLMAGLVLPSAWTAAAQDTDTRSWMVVLPRSMDAQPETYEVGPLEEGESRQFFTNDGDEIVVSRNEKGRTVKVNGNTIQTHFDRSVHVVSDDDEHHQIHIQKKIVVSGDHEGHIEHEGEEEHEVHVEADEEYTGPMHIQILKSAPHRGAHINSYSVSEDGPTILFIDRVHVERNE
jgi:hypothetical protein